MRSKATVLGFFLILLFINGLIVHHEKSLASGRRVVLELAPADPRSIMQGDYMRLRYRIASEIHPSSSSGQVYLKLASDDTVEHVLKEETPGTVGLAYRVHEGRMMFNIESYFFQEGQRRRFEAARYAEVKISSGGTATLVCLLDEKFQPIEP